MSPQEQASDRPRDLADWPTQSLRGHKLDGHRYTSKEFAEQEWEYMWTRIWLLLGREDEMPNPGDWQQEEVGRESILMVRQKDGGIKAFYNVCQHRGQRLVTEKKGHIARFICPYHSWAWNPDGSLDFVQDADDFPDGNPCGKLVLEEIPSETFAGFVWVNMNPDCVSLREFLGPVWDEWEAYGIEKWKRYVAKTTMVPVNWKVVLDNFNESYHVNTVHRPKGDDVEKLRIHSGVDTRYKTTRFDMANEGHGRMIMLGGYAGPAIDKEGAIGEPLASILTEWELDPADFSSRGEATREALQAARRKLGPDKGYDYFENLNDSQLTDAYHYTLFPNFAVSLWVDGFHFLRARPHPTDPEQCLFDNWWYAPDPEGVSSPVRTTAGLVERGAAVDHEEFEAGTQTMGLTIDQDMSIFPGQQLSMRSRGYRGSYLGGQETRVSRLHELIDDYIEGKRS
ncbi:MAG: aromatic ring-hydroxylating dioxygenase subunit alpha [Halioglobus sp.]|nr:aromatic ring-hydroxylating dioxygenase subunit alpha [Halioglobus sp.]